MATANVSNGGSHEALNVSLKRSHSSSMGDDQSSSKNLNAFGITETNWSTNHQSKKSCVDSTHANHAQPNSYLLNLDLCFGFVSDDEMVEFLKQNRHLDL